MAITSTQPSDSFNWPIDSDKADPAYALEYLNNPEHFPSFSSGLTELISKYGYKERPDHTDDKTRFLLSKLSEAEISITRATVLDWFREKRRPNSSSESREHMFHVCFALSVSPADMEWFFGRVYFDRTFNCHTVEEAVYDYCLTHKLPYRHAEKLIAVIRAFPDPKAPSGSGTVFTKDIIHSLKRCETDEELLRFFKHNKHIFHQWNQTAMKYINGFDKLIRGKKSDKAVINACKAGKTFLPEEVRQCGLIVQEYLLAARGGRFDYISGKSIDSVDFMLERMITLNSGLSRQAPVPLFVKRNFPSKKTFSDILNRCGSSTSYDSIRKCLILLKFYHFWAALLLQPDLIDHSPFDIYCDETNALLAECGYEDLFPGNPYDWLFLWASACQKPLDALRGVISSIDSA